MKRPANIIRGFALGLALTGLLAEWLPAAELRFERPDYFVLANEPFVVRVLFDDNPALPNAQPPEQGFFSVGAALRFPSGAAVTSVEEVLLPEELNDDGLGNPPLKEVLVDRVGGAGALNILAGAAPYTNTLVLTVTLTNLAGSGSYTLDAELFLPAPFNNFVSGDGQRLDPTLASFGAATVHVLAGVPDPLILELQADEPDQWRLTFADPFGLPSLYELEGTTSLNDPVLWQIVPVSNLLQTGPGLFEAIFSEPGHIRFYRLKALIGLQ